MEYTLTINTKNAEAVAFLEYAKKLKFVKITSEIDESGLTAEDKTFIAKLSQKTKKAAAKRFYAKMAEKNNL